MNKNLYSNGELWTQQFWIHLSAQNLVLFNLYFDVKCVKICQLFVFDDLSDERLLTRRHFIVWGRLGTGSMSWVLRLFISRDLRNSQVSTILPVRNNNNNGRNKQFSWCKASCTHFGKYQQQFLEGLYSFTVLQLTIK